MKSKASNARTGLLAGGNWIIDQVKLIDVYPQRDQLANIRSQSEGTGGSPYNVLIDLARLGAPFPLFGAGHVGNDALGQTILNDCRKNKIDTRYLAPTAKAPTSYTDVMTELHDGHRTFFHARGANALWRGEDLDFKKLKARIFHLQRCLLTGVSAAAASLSHPTCTAGLRSLSSCLALAKKYGFRPRIESHG